MDERYGSAVAHEFQYR